MRARDARPQTIWCAVPVRSIKKRFTFLACATHPAVDEPVRNAALALVDTLNSVDIAAVLKEQSPQNPKENKIGIKVGTKP
jgi:hypothetical protein